MNDYVRGALMTVVMLFMNINIMKLAIVTIRENKVTKGSKAKRFFGFVWANVHIFLYAPILIGCNIALIHFVMRMWKI